MNENNYVTHEYLTDDRDARERQKLVVYWAPNGDFYIGSCGENDRLCKAVRICTSGGASSRNPKLVNAVRGVFEALGGFGNESEYAIEDQDRYVKNLKTGLHSLNTNAFCLVCYESPCKLMSDDEIAARKAGDYEALK